jgi:hypothetical protein
VRREVRSRHQPAHAVHAAIVGLDAADQLGRPLVTIHRDLMIGHPDLLFVEHRSADRAEPPEPHLKEGRGRLFEEDRIARGFPFLLSVLAGGEPRPGDRHHVGSGGEALEFEAAEPVRPSRDRGARSSRDRLHQHCHTRERLAGHMLHHCTADHRGLYRGREQEQRQ